MSNSFFPTAPQSVSHNPKIFIEQLEEKLKKEIAPSCGSMMRVVLTSSTVVLSTVGTIYSGKSYMEAENNADYRYSAGIAGMSLTALLTACVIGSCLNYFFKKASLADDGFLIKDLPIKLKNEVLGFMKSHELSPDSCQTIRELKIYCRTYSVDTKRETSYIINVSLSDLNPETPRALKSP